MRTLAENLFVAGLGIEPKFSLSESDVLPLDDPAMFLEAIISEAKNKEWGPVGRIIERRRRVRAYTLSTMKAILYVIIILALLGILAYYLRPVPKDQPAQPLATGAGPTATSTLAISSTAFTVGGSIPTEYTCDGTGGNPPLTFSGVPENAKSLALIMEDPDVPRDRVPTGIFDHWVVYDIPPGTVGVIASSTLPGVYGMNGAGKQAYAAPCPPDREHRYFFRLYALDTSLLLPAGTGKPEVLRAMEGHVIAKAELMGRYNRPQNK